MRFADLILLNRKVFFEGESDASDDIVQAETKLILPEPILQHIHVQLEPVITEFLEDGIIGKEHEFTLKQIDIEKQSGAIS